MKIALVSPISVADLKEFLIENDSIFAAKMSNGNAPAVTSLALDWLKDGNSLVIFTLDHNVKDLTVLHGEKLTVYVGPGRAKTKIGRILAPIYRDTRLLTKMIAEADETFDVVSAHWTRDYALACRQLTNKYPVFVTVRDIMPYILKKADGLRNKYPMFFGFLKNEVVMRNRKFHHIANSKYTAASVLKYWRKEVPVIPNPIQDRFFSLENKNNVRSDLFRIATISSTHFLDTRKNILTLLKAFGKVREIYKNASLSLIGPSFIESNPVAIELKKEGLLENVELKGGMAHDDVVRYLQTMDLMVHPSLEETFGNTLVEAMAAQCAVLGGENSGAVPYVLDNGNAGYLCDVSSEEKIADSILHIIKNKEEREAKIKYASDYSKENFSSKKVAEKYLDIFQKYLKHDSI